MRRFGLYLGFLLNVRISGYSFSPVLEGFSHFNHGHQAIRLKVLGLGWQEKAFKPLPVDEYGLIFAYRLDPKDVFSTKQDGVNHRKAPGKFTQWVHPGDLTGELHIF